MGFFDSVGDAFKDYADFVRDPTSIFGGSGKGTEFVERQVRSVKKTFRPDMPEIPTPPTPGAPIRQASTPASPVSDLLFGRGVGRRAVQTRGPGIDTLLTRRRRQRQNLPGGV